MAIHEFRHIDIGRMHTQLSKTLRGEPHIRNYSASGVFVIEGDDAGLSWAAVYFIAAAKDGLDVHLYAPTRGDPEFMAPFEAGIEVGIGDGKHGAETRGKSLFATTSRIKSFRHEGHPVTRSGSPPLRPGSECWTSLERAGFTIDGNLPALLTFAEHLFDLGELETPPGTELSYVPRVQLLEDSAPFAFRRTA